MRRKKMIWTAVLLVLAVGSWYGYKEYTRTSADLKNVKANIKISAIDIIKEYEINEPLADKKYPGKIVELSGTIKDVTKDESGFYTIVLGDTASLSSVQCSADTTHQLDAARLVIGSSVIVRGACTGFRKDEMGLGADVILNRCVIIEKK